MKNIVFSMFILISALALFSNTAFACSGDKDRLGFNIGTEAYAIQINPATKSATFKLDSGTMSDIKYTATVSLTQEGIITLSIPSKGINYKGRYGAIYRCLGSPTAVKSWEDQTQNAGLEKVRSEVLWLADHKEYSYWENNGVRLYISTAAYNVLDSWKFTLNKQLLLKAAGNEYDLNGGGDTDYNTVVFLDLDDKSETIQITGKEVKGKDFFYTLQKNGILTDRSSN